MFTKFMSISWKTFYHCFPRIINFFFVFFSNCIKKYISHRCNSWGRFRVQKSTILDTQIQMGVSQRVSIPSRASKYMLESKRESFRKWKKNWSWATSFWIFGNFKKYAIYIFYIYALRGYSGWWSCPTSKKFFFWEFTSVYALHLA